jgi:RNA:NAD 2'-phosphotransferase (TPT1/KptA family)
MANFNAISHLMVGALRHGNHGAVTDEAGWMPVATLVALPRFVSLGADQQSIQDVIRTEHKKRFETEIRGGDLYIRVKQGWSLSSGVILEKALPSVLSPALPDFLVHASFLQCQQSILSHGLLCGSRLQNIGGPSRSQVHWFPCKSITLLERQRAAKRNKTLLVVVRPKVLEAHGVKMFQAQPLQLGWYGAVLTDVVGPRLFEHILDRGTLRVTEAWLEALQREFTERQSQLFF